MILECIINQPFHAPVLEVSVWTPTPSLEDEVCNISEASVTNNVPVGAIPHQPLCVKCSTVGILFRNIGEKNRISQHKTQLDSVAFIPSQPIVSAASCVLWVVRFCFFLESIIDLHTQNFPPKMNSGFCQTTQNLETCKINNVVVWVLQIDRDE